MSCVLQVPPPIPFIINPNSNFRSSFAGEQRTDESSFRSPFACRTNLKFVRVFIPVNIPIAAIIMALLECIECGPSDEWAVDYFMDDVVTGDTICTRCGLVADRSCMLTSYFQGLDIHAEEYTSYADAVRSTSSPTPPVTMDTAEQMYDSILARLSAYTVEITRSNRIVMRSACLRAVQTVPRLAIRRPEMIVLAIFVIFTKPAGRPRKHSELLKDHEFVGLCTLLGVRPSSVCSVLRALDPVLIVSP